jgi:hypothetical protein
MYIYEIKNRSYTTCGWLTPVILPTQEAEIRIMVQSQTEANSSWDLISKNNTKHASRVAQVVEGLPSKYEALSSNQYPPYQKKKKTQKLHIKILSRSQNSSKWNLGFKIKS